MSADKKSSDYYRYLSNKLDTNLLIVVEKLSEVWIENDGINMTGLASSFNIWKCNEKLLSLTQLPWMFKFKRSSWFRKQKLSFECKNFLM